MRSCILNIAISSLVNSPYCVENINAILMTTINLLQSICRNGTDGPQIIPLPPSGIILHDSTYYCTYLTEPYYLYVYPIQHKESK